VESILTNEKYKGDALLQKTYCTDFLTRKMKRNKGEVPQYYVEGSHQPIVSAELFDHAQDELRRRKETGNIFSTSCFSGRIVCGDCGGTYGSKVWHSTDKYRRTVWQCNGKYKGVEKCGTPTLSEKDIKNAFLGFVNSLITDRQDVIRGLNESLAAVAGDTGLERERDTLQAGCETLLEMARGTVRENTRSSVSGEGHNESGGMTEKYRKACACLAEADRKISARNARRNELEVLLHLLDGRDSLLADFDEALWLALVHQMKVHAANEFSFVLKDGSELPWVMPVQ
jgi:site-specific DNA recombinase